MSGFLAIRELFPLAQGFILRVKRDTFLRAEALTFGMSDRSVSTPGLLTLGVDRTGCVPGMYRGDTPRNGGEKTYTQGGRGPPYPGRLSSQQVSLSHNPTVKRVSERHLENKTNSETGL